MSNYRGHLVGGLISFFVCTVLIVACRYHLTGPSLLEWFFCATMGSLFPDIDIKSKGQKIFYWILAGLYFVLILTSRLEIIATLSMIATLPMLVNHRGIFHRLWFVILVPFGVATWLALCMPSYASLVFVDAFFFSAGAISHLWLDFGFLKMFKW